MSTDFSDYTGLIPAKTIAVVQMKLRYGDGTDNVRKRTRAGDGEGLDVEYTILDGEYARRKIFAFILVLGETEGQKAMAESNLARLKQIIDSAKFLDPNDKSPEARAKRSMGWRDFDGARFLAEIGVEEGRNGYADKNVIVRAITRDHALWGGRPPIDQAPPDFFSGGVGVGDGPAPTSSGGAAAQAPPQAAPPITKPAWAS